MVSPDTVIEAAHLGFFWTVVAVYVVGVIGLLGLIALAFYRVRMYRALAKQADAARFSDALLQAGPSIIVGTVEHAQDSDETVTVKIEQEGREEEDSGSWSHSWTETRRTVSVAPFYLRRPNGDRIRVEPTKKVFLVDDMDGHILVNRSERIRIAQLVPGEEIIAKGVLSEDFDPESLAEGAYRDMPKGWVLKAPSRRQPLFLSSEPLAARFLRLQRFHRNAAVLLLLVFIGMQLVNIADHARVFAGTTEEATIYHLYTYITTDDDGDETTHYAAMSNTGWGGVYGADISGDLYAELEEGDVLLIRHAGRDFVQYGGRPNMDWITFLLCFGIFIGAGVLYRLRTLSKRTWYEGDLKSKASGRLDENTGLVFERGLLLRDHDDED